MNGQKQKMLAGELYCAADPELEADQARVFAWLDRYNARIARAPGERQALLEELLGKVGAGCNVRPPFYCDYGYNITLGTGVFMNFGCVLLDVMPIVIGDKTQIGPGVQILAADHPRDPTVRAKMLEFGRPVTIGANVWIGAGAIILPGVSVGDDAIIGAGGVVTRDVPPGATAYGNPARVKAR